MTYSILGDSISTFAGEIPPDFDCFYPREGYSVTRIDQTWWYKVGEKLGAKLLINNSYSGSRISKTGIEHEHTSAFIDPRRLSLIPASDILFVFGGTNDFGQEKNQASLKRFQHAYRILVQTLAKRNDISKIYFMTPLIRTDIPIHAKNTRGWTQNTLSQTIIDEVRRVNCNKIHVINLFEIPISQGDGMLEDNLHPSIHGMQILSDFILTHMSC